MTEGEVGITEGKAGITEGEIATAPARLAMGINIGKVLLKSR
jgi:hypothetical protein